MQTAQTTPEALGPCICYANVLSLPFESALSPDYSKEVVDLDRLASHVGHSQVRP